MERMVFHCCDKIATGLKYAGWEIQWGANKNSNHGAYSPNIAVNDGRAMACSRRTCVLTGCPLHAANHPRIEVAPVVMVDFDGKSEACAWVYSSC